VRLWQTVTVASASLLRCINITAIGLPTMSLRPTTTTLAPAILMFAHQQLLNAVRRTGEEPRPALHDAAHIVGMEGVQHLSAG